ncbi:MAG: efflux RND transporter periplasmic adaptor subunit [Pseudomonadota bacterium]
MPEAEGVTRTHNEVPGEPVKAKNAARRPSMPNASDAALKLARRAMEAEDPDKLYFLLTNDTRSLVEFDRAFLILHLGGESGCVAVNNQPTVEKKSSYSREFNELAPALANQDKTILLSSDMVESEAGDAELQEEARAALKEYMNFSKGQYLVSVPLVYDEKILGQLLLEFVDSARPDRGTIAALLTAAPVFAAALAQKWVEVSRPDVRSLLDVGQGTPAGSRPAWIRRIAIPGIAVLAIVLVLFVIPVTFRVGGEAEVIPRETYRAFAKMDGIVESVLVEGGTEVHNDQPIAEMDTTDIEYELLKASREIKILGHEISVLGGEASYNSAKLTALKIAQLKKSRAGEMYEFLKRRKEFLTITSPVKGIIVTKGIEALRGKSFKKGESFCEIAVPTEMTAEVRVPDDRVSYVKVGQKAHLYLNADPGTAYPFEVEEIAPIAEVFPVLGNVYPVRGRFKDPPDFVKLGMKGVAKIDAGTAHLWHIITERLLTRWNQFMLYF